MAHSIDVEIVMANLLRHKDKITLKEIVETSERLTTEIPGIYISASNRTIFGGIEYFPEMFEWNSQEHVVKRIVGSERYYSSDALENKFNYNIPLAVKEQFLKLFELDGTCTGVSRE